MTLSLFPAIHSFTPFFFFFETCTFQALLRTRNRISQDRLGYAAVRSNPRISVCTFNIF